MLDSRRAFFACQKRALQRLEVLAAQQCASPQGKGDLACHSAVPRWPALPDPYVERREVMRELVQKIEKAPWLGGWGPVRGSIQVGKTVLLTALRLWIEQGAVPSGPWEGIAFVTADVPTDTTQEELERARLRLIGDLAEQLGVPLPDEAQTSLERALALKIGLGTRRVLILVDNVKSAQVLLPLKSPPCRVVCVLATRSTLVAEEMAPAEQQIHLRGMTMSEALELTQAITGDTTFDAYEKDILADLYDAVRGHPLALVILAKAALRTNSWLAVRSAFPEGVCAEEARSTKGGAVGWREVIAQEWACMGEDLRRRLARLGCLPFLSTYDVGIGQALWKRDKDEVRWAFLKMVESGLLEPVGLGYPPCVQLDCRVLRGLRLLVEYWIPWPLWLFAQEQRRELKPGDVVRCAVAAWRYPLEKKHPEGSGLLVPLIPSSLWELVGSAQPDYYNVGLVPVWLGRKYTYHRFPPTPPVEWAVVMRMRSVYLSIWMLALVAVALGKVFNFPCAVVLGLLVAAVMLLLATDNQHRLSLWRRCKKSFVERA